MATCPWLSAGHHPRGVSLAAQLSGCVGAGPHRSPPRLLQPCGRVPGTPRRPRLPVSQSWAPELPFAPPPPSGRCSPPERPSARVLLSVDPSVGQGAPRGWLPHTRGTWTQRPLAAFLPRALGHDLGRLCRRGGRVLCRIPRELAFNSKLGHLPFLLPGRSRAAAGEGGGARLWGGPVRAFGPGVVTAGTFFPF